jgi:hypothetical protein
MNRWCDAPIRTWLIAVKDRDEASHERRLMDIKSIDSADPMLKRSRSNLSEPTMADQRSIHEESITEVAAPPQALFDYLDDPRRLGSHMEQGSWRTAGASMAFELDAAQGRSVGSQIRLRGRVLGMSLALAEVVSEHEPPRRKVWRTVGTPRLLVIGAYAMGFDIAPVGNQSRLTVFIDYSPPPSIVMRALPSLARFYARWCVKRMAEDARRHFERGNEAAAQRA